MALITHTLTKLLATSMIVTLAPAAHLGESSPLAQQDDTLPVHYAAVIVGVQGRAGGTVMNFDFRINEWTTDAEAKQHAALLAESGVDVLRRALEKVEKGNLGPTGRVGTDIAIARWRALEDGGKRILPRTRPSFNTLLGHDQRGG